MSLLVTGATGSLGRAIVQRALATGEPRIVAYDQDEFGHFMLQERTGAPPALRLLTGDVRDPAKLARCLNGVTRVIHCAARKWVATAVYNVDELVDTNVGGTRSVIEAAALAGVPRVLVITSDKGVAPTNAYGATKFLAECYAVSANAWTYPAGTRVAALRLGNLLWSRGSVAHRWRQAHAHGKPIALTAEGMTRYGIRLSAAAALALEVADVLRGGEVFVPDLPAYALERLADAVAPDAEIVLTGDRGPGEKRHETMLSFRESLRAVPIGLQHWARMVVLEPERPSWTRLPWADEGTWLPPRMEWRSDCARELDDLALDEMDDE